jgi:hypothetical protein
VKAAPPPPSSQTARRRTASEASASTVTVTVTVEARACSAALVSASATMYYALTSMCSGSRASPRNSSSIGIGERWASALRAGRRPPLARIAGWMPRAISRSSSSAPLASATAVEVGA